MDFSAVPVTVLFVITLAAGLITSTLRRVYSRSLSGGTMREYYFFNAAISIVVALALLILTRFDLRMSVFTLLMGLAFGVINSAQTVLNLAALKVGPYAYTSVIISMSTVITALSGFFFWHEHLLVTQLIGIAFMVVCFVLSVKNEEGEAKKASLRWFLLCILACLCSGGVGLMQKTHQTSAYKAELMPFLMIAFFFSFLFSAVMWYVVRRAERRHAPASPATLSAAPDASADPDPIEAPADAPAPKSPRAALWLVALTMVLSGLSTAAIHTINLYLSGVVASAIFFPVVNGGGLMLITLTAIFVFRERLTRRQWLGLASGLVAVLLLCIRY